MWHLSHSSLRFISLIAAFVLVTAWKSDLARTSTGQAHGSDSVAARSKGNSTSTTSRLSSAYGTLPISFEMNQGQTDASVQFLARGAGYILFLTPGEAVLSLHSPHASTAKLGRLATPNPLRPSPSQLSAGTPTSKVRLQLIGSNTAAKVEGVDPLPGKSNYFAGNDPAKWHTDVPTYAKVRYTNVYPGIDLLYYGNQEGRFEHDFVVAPGADPRAIAIGLRDSDGAVPDKNGGLTLHTKNGDLTLQSPTVYQHISGQRKTITATYLLANNQIKFQLGSYDKKAPLVIDPVLRYTAVFGGTGDDVAQAIAADGSGNAYVTGYTYSLDFPLAHPFQRPPTNNAYPVAFVSKINAGGTALLYSTYLGGAGGPVPGLCCGSGGDVEAFGIAVDNSGRAYVTGSTYGGLPTRNAYQPTKAGFDDAFLTVLSPAGDSLVFSTYLGGTSPDQGRAIALDASGNAYITGSTYGGFPALNSVQKQGRTFVAKFNRSGVLQYSSNFSNGVTVNAIAVDISGAAYISGFQQGTGSISVTNNAFQKTCLSPCGFITKFSPSGARLAYSTYFPSLPTHIAADSSGNAYIVGGAGPGFPVTKNAFQKTFGGSNIDGFVTKLNPSGSALIWSTYLGGSGGDAVQSIALDQYRTVYLTGFTTSSDFPVKAPVQPYRGGIAGFVTTLSGSLGSIEYYSTHIGTANDANFIAVDKALNVYVSTGISSTPGALSTGTSGNPGGLHDVFISKLVIMDDLALGVSGSSSAVAHGGNLTYTIAVTSKGPDFGYNVRIDDPLPAGTTFVSYNAVGGTCTAPAVGGTGTLHCALPQLNKGQTYTVALTVKVNAVAGTTLSNTATTVSNMQDFVQSNNKGTLFTKVN